MHWRPVFSGRCWSQTATSVVCWALGILLHSGSDARAATHNAAVLRGEFSASESGSAGPVSAVAVSAESRSADSPVAGGYVPLGDVVLQVQKQFHATAVRADTVREAGDLVYRIRLLSADKSHVWTVDVDARTGRLR